jgi:tRNA A-37 threonylcarbamoyl transferase component Bud32
VPIGDETLRSAQTLAMSHDPLIGQRVGDYFVDHVVGSGAMGIVYRAHHEMIGKTVAIKVLRPHIADDPEMVDRLVREARTVNAIHHPGIVDIFGFGKLASTGQSYVVMDLLVGESFEAWVKRECPVPFSRVFRFIDELLSAVGAAHDVGVIHRDLKPGNMFLEKQREGSPKVKLLDFGLARQADRAQGSVRPTNPGTLLGTPAFMAPEQVMGQKTTPATDLYAVGGILYQVLTGHLPHEATSAVEVLSLKMLHPPNRMTELVPDIDRELERVVLSLLEREASARPQKATEVRAHLKSIGQRLGGKSSTPTPVPRKPTARNWQEARTLLAGEAQPVPAALTIPIATKRTRDDVHTVVGHAAPAAVLGDATLVRGAVEPVTLSDSTVVPATRGDATLPFHSPVPETATPALGTTAQERTALVARRAEVLAAVAGANKARQPAVEMPLVVPRSNLPLYIVGALAVLVLIGVVVVLFRAR